MSLMIASLPTNHPSIDGSARRRAYTVDACWKRTGRRKLRESTRSTTLCNIISYPLAMRGWYPFSGHGSGKTPELLTTSHQSIAKHVVQFRNVIDLLTSRRGIVFHAVILDCFLLVSRTTKQDFGLPSRGCPTLPTLIMHFFRIELKKMVTLFGRKNDPDSVKTPGICVCP